jgi:hypothetical protein
MPTVTLVTKVYNNSQLTVVDEFLKSTLKGLDVEAKVAGVSSHKWVQVAVSGEDEKVALHYLADEIGLCPASLEDIKKFSVVRGYVIDVDKNGSKLCVDIGVHLPKTFDVSIPLRHLQAQLLDGRKVTLKEIFGLYGFCDNLPLGIKVCHIDLEHKRIEATFSEEQLNLFGKWIKSLLDRLLILGASVEEIESVLKTTKCDRDVINIEPLGLFEYAIVCKLGTDAKGLIPKIGRNLRNAVFAVFDPKRVLEFLDYSSSSFPTH